MCGAINPFTNFPLPQFFRKVGPTRRPKKERVKLYTQLKKTCNPSSQNIQELLTTTQSSSHWYFRKANPPNKSKLSYASPLSQLLQYNKQNRTVLRCSLAQAEPRSQYIQLFYIIYCCATQIKQKFFYLHYFAAGQSDSQVGTLAALFPYFWSSSPVDSWKLVVNGQGCYSIGPTLQFPKVWRRISLYCYARSSSSPVGPPLQLLYFH